MNCPNHPSQVLQFVCIAYHNCQRSLCPQCLNEHKTEIKYILPNQVFLDSIQKKVGEQQLNLKFQPLRTKFKTLLSQSESTFKKQFEDINVGILKIYEMMEQEDYYYKTQINSVTSVSELSQKQLSEMVNMLQGDSLQKWKSQKDSYINQLEVVYSQLKNEFNKFIAQINQCCQGLFWEERTQEQEGLQILDGKLSQTKFQIHFSKKRELQYIMNGEIIKTILHCDLSSAPQIMTNLEKIKNLQWIGEYDQNFKKVGLWKAKWKDEIIKGLGGQYSNGKMQGKWKDTIANYSEKAKAYEIGEYKENFKIGAWKYIYNDQKIGGGEYNVQGLKQGNWIEIGEYFWDHSLIANIGQYQNGQKVGDWKFCLIEKGIFGYNFNKKIGGGIYKVEEGFSKKIGMWIEINNQFKLDNLIEYGEYDKNGKKFGRWDIYQKNQEIYQWLGLVNYTFQNIYQQEDICKIYKESITSKCQIFIEDKIQIQKKQESGKYCIGCKIKNVQGRWKY